MTISRAQPTLTIAMINAVTASHHPIAYRSLHCCGAGCRKRSVSNSRTAPTLLYYAILHAHSRRRRTLTYNGNKMRRKKRFSGRHNSPIRKRLYGSRLIGREFGSNMTMRTSDPKGDVVGHSTRQPTHICRNQTRRLIYAAGSYVRKSA